MIRSLALCLLASASIASSANAATVVTADRYLDVFTGKYVDHPAIFIGDDGRITNRSGSILNTGPSYTSQELEQFRTQVLEAHARKGTR